MSAGRPRRVYLEDLSEAANLRAKEWTWTAIGDTLGIDPSTLRAAIHLFRAGRSYPARKTILNTVSEHDSSVTAGGSPHRS